MKKLFHVCCFVFFIGILCGCSGTSDIDMVKEGSLYMYPDYTVSEIFKNNVTQQDWEAYEEDGIHHVKCSGISASVDGGTLEVVFDFTIDEDTFDFYRMEVNGEVGTMDDFEYVIDVYVNGN